MPIKFHEGSKTFHIYNKHLSYITCIMENGQMENLYYGKAIRDKEDFSYLHEEIMRSLMAVCVPEPGLLSMQYTKQEYPVYGTGDYRNPALTVRQENGSEIVDFKYVSHEIYGGKKKLAGLPATYTENEEEATSLDITLAIQRLMEKAMASVARVTGKQQLWVLKRWRYNDPESAE